MHTAPEIVLSHFAACAERADRSSRWCTDPELGRRTVAAAALESHHRVLDVACGAGQVSRLFRGRVAEIVGVDVTREMFEQARPWLDALIEARAEALPFPDASFDRVVCRQGIQLMDAPAAVREMVRVTRPGGRIVLVHLVAYGEEDRAEYFEVLHLRNPARRNFFARGDLARLLGDCGCSLAIETHHVSIEDVDAWADDGAIDEARREAIREVYARGTDAFRRLHAVRAADGRLVDRMLFAIAAGMVPVAGRT